MRAMVRDTNKDDEKYRDIQFYQDTYKGLLSFLGSGAGSDLENKVYQWNEELSVINNNLVAKDPHNKTRALALTCMILLSNNLVAMVLSSNNMVAMAPFLKAVAIQ